MKPSLPALFVVALLAAILAGCASPVSDGVTASRTRFLDLPIEANLLFDHTTNWTLYVERGDSRESVAFSCGRPDAVINANLWVYRNCFPSGKTARIAGNCDTVLIAFANDRVIVLKLVNWEVLQAELAKQAQRPGQVMGSL